MKERTSERATAKRRGASVALLWCVAVVVAAVAGLWAGRATGAPVDVPEVPARSATYVVGEGTVGREIRFPAVASWPSADIPPGQAAGVLTSVAFERGALVDNGTLMYTVDLRPVTLLHGVVPAFRDLQEGVEGPDVAQLKAYFRLAGYLSATRTSPKFDGATVAAAKRWQRAIGVEPDGVVRAADVLFAPELPVRVALAEGVHVGVQVSAQAPVLTASSALPQFSVRLASEQAATAPTDGPVEVVGHGWSWAGVIARAEQVEDNLVLTLTAADGTALCGSDCARLAPTSDGSSMVLQAEFVVVPETTGPVVPTAALGVGAGGTSYVTLEDGQRVDVAVIVQSGGLAVVDGVAIGETIKLFGASEGDDAETAPTS